MSLRELAILVLAAAGSLGTARADDRLTLERAVERALAGDAEVRGAAAEVRAARARLDQASAPLAANPALSAGIGPRDGGDGSRTVDYELALSQPIEIAGQRGARVAAGRAALGAAEARLAATRARVKAEVRARLARVVAAGMRAALASEAERLAEQAATAAEKRLQAGDVARIEVDSARLERGRAARARLEADQEQAAALAELELALAVEPGASLELAFRLGEGRAGERSRDALVRAALDTRGDLAAARLDLAAARAEASLAARSAVPTPTVGISYAREERANILLGTLSIDLPVFARNQAERGATSARVDQASAALAALERRVAQEVRLAAGRVDAARRALASFDAATLAALEENLAAVTRAYETGKIDFVRYQLLRREALEARRDRVDALEGLDRAEAELQRALGEP